MKLWRRVARGNSTFSDRPRGIRTESDALPRSSTDFRGSEDDLGQSAPTAAGQTVEGMPRSRWRIARSRKRRRNEKAWSIFPVERSRVDPRRNDRLACFRTVDMIGNAVALNATTVFQSTEQDRVDVIFDRFSSKDHAFSPGDLASIENARLDASIVSRHRPTESHAKSSNRTAEDTANDRRTFLESCAELASHGQSADHEQRRAPTWFSRFRRRCSTVRDWLPTMCSCLEGSVGFARVGNYQRLGDKSNALEFDRAIEEARSNRGGDCSVVDVDDDGDDDDDDDEEEVEELRFYNDDLSWNNLLVQRNLRTIDACQLLKIKRNVSGIDWSIVETWPELGIERTLEDHEDISAVYRDMKSFASRYERKLVFRLDFLKYEFFFDPEQFSPNEMVDFPAAFADDEGTLTDAETALTNYLQKDDGECPQVFSLVWIRIDRLDVWRRTHMLLRDRKLYLARKTSVVSLNRLPDNEHQLIPLAHLTDYSIYKITNAKKRLKAPFEWGICLRPSCNGEADSTVPGESGLKTVVFHSEKSRVCWLTAMRLAKYGKQLRENYRAFKNRQCEQGGGDGRKERYVNYNVSNESTRSRVAMDFTGSVGRIVEDPQEAKNIAESEGVNWRRTWRPFSRAPPGCAVVRLHGLDDGIHVLQPWFHRDLKRDVAAAIVRDHGSVDGVFLVRESKSNLGAYVLTYKYSDKVFHAQIQPVFDERCNCWLYTLDKGITKFYDLLQLIEFYQLNAGCLPTRLTRYVRNGVPCAVPSPEDGGASPSPPELAHRFSNVANVVSVVNVATTAGHRSI